MKISDTKIVLIYGKKQIHGISQDGNPCIIEKDIDNDLIK